MKKLMIAAAIVCAAVFAQAASVDWSTGYFNGSNNQMAYMNEMNSWTYSVLVEFSNGVQDTGTESYGSFSGSPTGFALNTDYTASIVITEKDDQGNVKTLTASGTFTSSDNEGLAKVINFGTGDGFKAGTFTSSGWQSVPEPTSGLLLLLGVAGLALRRRRA